MSIFRTGRIIITGARDMDQIHAAYNFLNGVFECHARDVLLKRSATTTTTEQKAPVALGGAGGPAPQMVDDDVLDDDD
jgi:hypothetical protein